MNVTTTIPITWYVNHTLFSVDTYGVIMSRIVLPLGIFALKITATNIYGSSIVARFRAVVTDTTAPNWVFETTHQRLKYDEGLDYQMAASDLSGIDHWTLSDNIHFTYTATYQNEISTIHIRNATILSPGTYTLTLTVYDPYNNTRSALFIVSVMEASITVVTTTSATITHTTESTTSTSPTVSNVDPIFSMILGMGISGLIVAVIIEIYLKKKKS